ncbi:T9SS type B sorting domain-containing protein [Flavobacterium faecale]|uniref:T9SS type B sorting domain-containing protein n=1 Tax=Flavobacterium faecale TaxID=1355330 RepID=UPI003AAF0CC4
MRKFIKSFTFLCIVVWFLHASLFANNLKDFNEPNNNILKNKIDLSDSFIPLMAVAPPVVSSPIYYCQGSTASPLTATASPGNTLIWYGTAATGGTPSITAPTPSTSTVGSTTYYVSETDGSTVSSRSQIVVNVVADNGSKILSFRCDPTQIAAADKNSSVYFDWTNTGSLPNQYTYFYTIDGGPAITGTTGPTNLQVFGLAPGKSVTLTLWHTTYPCDRSVLTCSVPCGTSTVTPTFTAIGSVCQGSTAPALPSSSNEGIAGTWSPATINSSTVGTVTHTFTPDPVAHPCATTQTMNVTVVPRATPTFATIPSTVCQNATPPVLPTNSNNSPAISGSWSPSTVNTAVLGPVVYTFTPNAGQCATTSPTTVTITVIANNSPNFANIPPLCSGSTPPVLATTSPTGVTGSWSPATINNTTSGSYVFTPNPNQCSTAQTLNVTITPKSTPNFAPIAPFCAGSTAPVLNSVSPNGISGSWSPATVSNTTSGSYLFTPDPTECAFTQTLNVTVNQPINPGFSSFSICSGSVPPALASTSPNGVNGSWNPAVIDNMNTGSYVFTPNSGECATQQTIVVTVVPSNTLVDFQWTVSEAFADNQIVTINATAPGNYLYQLDFGPFQESSVFENVSYGLHSVTVKDPIGCSIPITKTNILVVDFPRFFTPNGDGYNDTWNIDTLKDDVNAKIRIFDRYGKLLVEVKPNSAGWNGFYNGNPMPATDYWFVIDYVEDNVLKKFRSHFSLKR